MASATYNSLAADVSLNPDGGFSLFRINLHLFVVPTTNNISNHYRQFQPRRRFFSLSQKREKVRGKKRERLVYGESRNAVRALKVVCLTDQFNTARSVVSFRLTPKPASALIAGMSALPRFDSVYVTLGNRTAFHPLFSNLFVFYAMPCILEAFVVILKRKRIKATFSTAQGLAKMRERGSICYGTELYVFGCRGGACARPHGGNMRLSLCSGRRNKTPLFRAKPSFWVLVDLFSARTASPLSPYPKPSLSLFFLRTFSLFCEREKNRRLGLI